MRIDVVTFRTFLPAIALVATAGCGSQRGGAAVKVPVSVARVERSALPYELDATGTVEPIRSVDVLPQVGGTILHVNFAEGDEVAAGQILFEMKQSTADADEAAVRSDPAAAALARLNLEYATGRAPIGGRTGRLLLHEGNLVRAGNDPLVSIVQMRPILVRFPVPAISLPAIRQRAGQQLAAIAMPARDSASSIQGILSFVDNQVDTSTGTVLLKARFQNRDGGLWP